MSGPHNDGDEKFPCESFDGPGGVLAHTCMPELKNASGDSFPLLSELIRFFWLIDGL